MDYAKAYRGMHALGFFSGFSILPHAEAIADLVEKHSATTILDYGCGKGWQYSAERVHDRWGGVLPTLYDPAVAEFAERPAGRFDGVICTDVLEHIAEADLDEVWADLFGYAERFLFASICCRPAKKVFPDGSNVHVTIRPDAEWRKQCAAHNPGIDAVLVFV